MSNTKERYSVEGLSQTANGYDEVIGEIVEAVNAYFGIEPGEMIYPDDDLYGAYEGMLEAVRNFVIPRAPIKTKEDVDKFYLM